MGTVKNFNLYSLFRNDNMKPEVDILKKAKTKFPKELHHILDKVAHSCPAFSCIGKLGRMLSAL